MTTPSRQKRGWSFVGGLIPPSSRKASVAEKGAVKKGHSYERLAKAFTLSGFGYRQIARQGNWAIYEQRWPGSENLCYEIIRIRREEATTFPSGRSYPAREVYPSSEAWGVDGFTVTDRNKAWDKFFEISLEEPKDRKGGELRNGKIV